MNSLVGSIIQLQSNEALTLVKINVEGLLLSSIVIDTPKTATYLKEGNLVKLFFKETEVIVSHDQEIRISLQNKIPCQIISVTKGLLLSEIVLGFATYHITSIITTNACEQLGLQENARVVALIKTNEISIAAYD